MTIRLGQWGQYALRAKMLSFCSSEAPSQSGKTRVGFYISRTNVLSIFRSGFCSASVAKAKGRLANLSFSFIRLLFYPIGSGQYLSCLIKCVGAKCTKRCYRVQQRGVRSGGNSFVLYLQHLGCNSLAFIIGFAPLITHYELRIPNCYSLPLCALSNSALCTLQKSDGL